MKNKILLTPDWITIKIKDKKDILIESEVRSVSMYPVVYELILPQLIQPCDLAQVEYRNFQGKVLWKTDYLTIYKERDEDFLMAVKAGYLLKPSGLEHFMRLLKLLKEQKVPSKITRIDYQVTFKTNATELVFKEFNKVETKLKKFKVEASNQTETISFGNSVFKVMLYLKSLQMEQVKKKSFRQYKKSFTEKYGKIEGEMVRLEYSLTSKNVFFKKIRDEIEKTDIVRDVSIDEISTCSRKYKLTKKFIKLIEGLERLKCK